MSAGYELVAAVHVRPGDYVILPTGLVELVARAELVSGVMVLTFNSGRCVHREPTVPVRIRTAAEVDR